MVQGAGGRAIKSSDFTLSVTGGKLVRVMTFDINTKVNWKNPCQLDTLLGARIKEGTLVRKLMQELLFYGTFYCCLKIHTVKLAI